MYEIFIQVKFRVSTEVGSYSDAIFYPEADFLLMSPDDITAAIQERTSSYLNHIKNPEAAIPLTEEQLLQNKQSLEEQELLLQDQLAAIDDQILEAQDIDKDIIPPTTPLNLVEGKVTSSSINFSWTESIDIETGLSGYNIYRDGKPIDSVNVNTYSDFKVLPGTEYTYQVEAIDFNKNLSDLSEGLTITTPK